MVSILQRFLQKLAENLGYNYAQTSPKREMKGDFMAKNLVLLQLNSVLDSSEKIKISPIGDFEGIDGRKYHLNAEAVLQRLNANAVDIVLDKNHEDDEAMGWFLLNSFELREDGVYAALELTPKGRELVQNRVYRYLSPAYVINWDIRLNDVMCIDRIASVGLVNRPNLLAQALNKDENSKPELKSNKEDSKMDEIATLKAEIEALKKENAELAAKLAEAEKAAAEKAKKEQENAEKARLELIENAINNKELLPKRKDAALALNGENLAAFLDVCKVEANAELSSKAGTIDAPKGEDYIDPKIKAQLGLE